MIRDRNVLSLSTLRRNVIEAETRTCFSSSVNNLGTHRALTCDIFNWEVRTLDLLIPVHSDTSLTVLRLSPSMTSFVALTLPTFMYGFRPRCALSVQPSLTRLCHLKQGSSKHHCISLCISVSCRVSVGVMPVCTQNWIAVRRAFSSSTSCNLKNLFESSSL